ncbi:MAG: acetyl/propionyl/methylcrotonyl-CoA carboxylase subunit alpha [Acidiferrobacterales bacterium]|nr:acetyl/propionyl/methylcrotonyl-CoA carboxylase subunit alpha [Acidiferrobacterales bacterium]
MFKKILIANRGEIACRVIKTARRMGIQTVAVYSDADRTANHVEQADEAIHIGGATAAESYLVIDRIVQACIDSGAEAVHPGYGFLSENSAFARALDAAGVAFIGPKEKAIEAMGDKITSKLLAEKAGVNVIPGHTDVVKDANEALEISKRIGFPVMIKASAGGGGKGMRVAWNDQECLDGFERATSEAVSSFGDGRIFIEKFIEQPRHIEIQVIADQHGNVVTLNERECSIQRRHQKVIEEAPSPFIDESTRAAMSAQAVALSKAVDYESAGTVELIVDAHRNFYFLEMNTRLQVEHPVTEMITGLDLVELMIRVAAGEILPVQQSDIGINGWSMESRIYAESPFRDFLPSTGRLVRYQAPVESGSVRVDTGVKEGSEISMFYDPMIAKLVTWGETREDSIEAMQHALDQYYIRGVETNQPFVAAIMAHPRFQGGELTTNFIAEEYPDGFKTDLVANVDWAPALAVVASIQQRLTLRAATTSGQMPGYGRDVSHDWVLVIDRKQYPVSIEDKNGGWLVELDEKQYTVSDQWNATDSVYTGVVNGQTLSLQIEIDGVGYYRVSYSGSQAEIGAFTPRTASLLQHMPMKEAPDLSGFLLSPMPGLLVSVAVEPGQSIKAGETLAVIEAMKMENAMLAEKDVVIAKVLAEVGTTLEVDQPIIEFER